VRTAPLCGTCLYVNLAEWVLRIIDPLALGGKELGWSSSVTVDSLRCGLLRIAEAGLTRIFVPASLLRFMAVCRFAGTRVFLHLTLYALLPWRDTLPVIVDVMQKPEIHDSSGRGGADAHTSGLRELTGYAMGKRFELEN